MKLSNVFGSITLATAVLLSTPASATTEVFDPLGNLNIAPAVDRDLVVFGGFFSPKYYTFSLSTLSNVLVDFNSLISISLGGTFGLQTSTGTNIGTPIAFPTINFLSGPDLSFNGLAAGNYRFAYNPGFFTGGIGTKITFTAIPVPEPETNALMMVGLGLMGFIARRKFVK